MVSSFILGDSSDNVHNDYLCIFLMLTIAAFSYQLQGIVTTRILKLTAPPAILIFLVYDQDIHDTDIQVHVPAPKPQSAISKIKEALNLMRNQFFEVRRGACWLIFFHKNNGSMFFQSFSRMVQFFNILPKWLGPYIQDLGQTISQYRPPKARK